MHQSVLDWVGERLDGWTPVEVLEVGSYDVNGTVKPLLVAAGAKSYNGCDVIPGPGVDRVYDGLTLPYPDAGFDTVVSTEMLEHCERPWRMLAEMARVLRPGGLVLVTARGWVVTETWEDRPGGSLVGSVACFGFHNPPDRWRFSGEAMRALAVDAGLTVDDVQQDPQVPGWFLAAHKP